MKSGHAGGIIRNISRIRSPVRDAIEQESEQGSFLAVVRQVTARLSNQLCAGMRGRQRQGVMQVLGQTTTR